MPLSGTIYSVGITQQANPPFSGGLCLSSTPHRYQNTLDNPHSPPYNTQNFGGEIMQFFTDMELYDNDIVLKLIETNNADDAAGYLPDYLFDICVLPDNQIAGQINLRIGHNENSFYGGNIGYNIHEQCRGNHYAAKACKLLYPLARKHGMEHLIITCSPDNAASIRTCELVGAALVGLLTLPEHNEQYADSRQQMMQYRVKLT